MQDDEGTITAGSPRWAVTLNHVDGDCETMPFTFDTETDAEDYGAEWVAEQPDEATYWTTRIDPPRYPAYRFGGRWICDGPAGRFHARTKRQLVEMLASHQGSADAR
jgi:hypothetical protein